MLKETKLPCLTSLYRWWTSQTGTNIPYRTGERALQEFGRNTEIRKHNLLLCWSAFWFSYWGTAVLGWVLRNQGPFLKMPHSGFLVLVLWSCPFFFLFFFLFHWAAAWHLVYSRERQLNTVVRNVGIWSWIWMLPFLGDLGQVIQPLTISVSCSIKQRK